MPFPICSLGPTQLLYHTEKGLSSEDHFVMQQKGTIVQLLPFPLLQVFSLSTLVVLELPHPSAQNRIGKMPPVTVALWEMLGHHWASLCCEPHAPPLHIWNFFKQNYFSACFGGRTAFLRTSPVGTLMSPFKTRTKGLANTGNAPLQQFPPFHDLFYFLALFSPPFNFSLCTHPDQRWHAYPPCLNEGGGGRRKENAERQYSLCSTAVLSVARLHPICWRGTGDCSPCAGYSGGCSFLKNNRISSSPLLSILNDRDATGSVVVLNPPPFHPLDGDAKAWMWNGPLAKHVLSS